MGACLSRNTPSRVRRIPIPDIPLQVHEAQDTQLAARTGFLVSFLQAPSCPETPHPEFWLTKKKEMQERSTVNRTLQLLLLMLLLGG